MSVPFGMKPEMLTHVLLHCMGAGLRWASSGSWLSREIWIIAFRPSFYVLLKELGTYKSGFEASDFAGPLSCSTLIPHLFLTGPLYFSSGKCELSSSWYSKLPLRSEGRCPSIMLLTSGQAVAQKCISWSHSTPQGHWNKTHPGADSLLKVNKLTSGTRV